jgi:hypothetical protein
MTDHLRQIALFVDEPNPGSFHWVMIESTDDASVWNDLGASMEPFKSWKTAWDTGSAEILKMMENPEDGPRAYGEDENANPVG